VPGTLQRFDPPHGPHVRVDTGYRAGDTLPPEYDNLIAKIAVWGDDRDEARLRAIAALRELRVDGVPTTAEAAAAVLAHDDFRTVAHSTRWLAENGKRLLRPVGPQPEVEVLGRWFRVPRFGDGDEAEARAGDPPGVTSTGGPPSRAGATAAGRRSGDGRVTAPMQGTVTMVDVEVGDAVSAVTRVVALEAMKMENALLAGVDGVVTAVHVAVGANVAPGTLLVEVRT
jgi:acetyl-CoA/propionyl-CoA carboxylase biotin carboxyl carrier protein